MAHSRVPFFTEVTILKRAKYVCANTHARGRVRSECMACVYMPVIQILGRRPPPLPLSDAVNTLCFVWKFSCIKSLSLIHPYK